MNNEGVKKSAILLLSLGSDGAAEVCKFLSPKNSYIQGQDKSISDGVISILYNMHKF